MDDARVRRTLWTLTVGHLAVAVSVVPVATMLVSHVAADVPADDWYADFDSPINAMAFVAGGLGLAVNQILSGRNLRALARAINGHIDVDQVARSLRRSQWSVVLPFFPITFGLPFLLTAQFTPLLFALFALVFIALLLECIPLGWIHCRLNQPGEPGDVGAYRMLPTGMGRRVRTAQPLVAGMHAMFGGVAVALLVATIDAETRAATGASPATLVQIVAAAAATAVPLLHIRAVLLVRAAITDDMVHLVTLRRAGASFIRGGTVAVSLTALVIASVLVAPAAPHLAVGRAALLVIALCIAATQFAELGSVHIGVFPQRWIRAADFGRSAWLRRGLRLPRRGGDEPCGAAADRRFDDRAGNAPASAAVTGTPPSDCPQCGQADQVQPVPAVHGGAPSSYYGGRPTAGGAGGTVIGDLAASLSPPPERNGPERVLGYGLVVTAGLTILFGIFLGVVAPQPYSSPGQFVGTAIVYAFFLLPGAAIFAALLLGYLSVRRRTDRHREHVSAAIELWRLGCYCHRCGGAFLPAGAGQIVPANQLMSADEFRDAVRRGNGRS